MSLVSAEDLLRAKVEREVWEEIRGMADKRIADLASVLEQRPGTSTIQRLAEGLDWKTNSRGEWTFVRTREGTERKELADLLEAISRTQGGLTLGGFVYSVSPDRKFLQRRRA